MTTHAYHIDPWARRIALVPCADLKDMQRLVRGCIEIAHEWPCGDIMFVNEEAMLIAGRAFFMFEGRPVPICGCAIVTGPEVGDDSGDLRDPSITHDALLSQVRFLTDEQVSAWAKANSSEPAVSFISSGDPEPTVIARMGQLFGSKPPRT